MEQQWEEILRERSSAVLDGLLGLALGLGAYSLTGFAIEELQDVGLVLVYFSVLFFLMVIFWQTVTRSLALARRGGWLFAINFILGALLVMTPLCLRLMLSSQPETKEVGYDLFPLVMGALSFLSGLGHVVVLCQDIAVPRDELLSMRAMTCGLAACCAVFFLSLRIPSEATVESYLPQVTAYLPPSLWQLPMRIGAWAAPFLLWMVVEGVIEHGLKRIRSKPEEKAPSVMESRRALAERAQAMTNSVFAMALGLCAYSLTDFAIGGREDLIMALLYFAFTFVVVMIFWGEMFRVSAAVPHYDETLLWGTILLTYFITLLPFFFRLVLSSDPTVAGLGLTLFPASMSAAAMTNSALFIIALRRRVAEMPRDDVLEMQRAALGGPVMAIVFIVSLRIPTTATLQSHLPQFTEQVRFIPAAFPLRALSWWLALAALFVTGACIELITERLTRRRG